MCDALLALQNLAFDRPYVTSELIEIHKLQQITTAIFLDHFIEESIQSVKLSNNKYKLMVELLYNTGNLMMEALNS